MHVVYNFIIIYLINKTILKLKKFFFFFLYYSQALLLSIGVLMSLMVNFSSGQYPFTSCKNISSPLRVRVRGCEKPPCKLIKDEYAEIEYDFQVRKLIHMYNCKICNTASDNFN